MARIKETLIGACKEVISEAKDKVLWYPIGYEAADLFHHIINDKYTQIPLCVVRLAQAHPVLTEYFGKPSTMTHSPPRRPPCAKQ